jgi:hypothetical protein
MTFHSPTLIRHLKHLEQQIVDAPRYAALLQAAFDGHDALQTLCGQLQAERHLRAMALTALEIKAQVVPGDGLGTTLESLSELVLRAARRVILVELGALTDVVNDAPAGDYLPALAIAPFERLDDWIAHVGHAVNGITQGWICYRGLGAIEQAAYRQALREAHVAMRQLGDTSRAAPFLHHAVNRVNWPALQEVCSRIWFALTLQIDVDPAAPVLMASPAGPETNAERAS